VTGAIRFLAALRSGAAPSSIALHEFAAAAASGDWTDSQLSAALMGIAIRGLDAAGTRALTAAMLESGERWDLGRDVPLLADKHSTGGVGDKTSLVLAPLLAEAGIPVVMLTGRALGHTGGTADKLEVIPGLGQDLDRDRARRLLDRVGIAIGVATPAIAPADRKLYALRDHTATIESLPLIAASILSKKLAAGARALVFDVKTGDGAFLPEVAAARQLAGSLVEIARSLGTASSALLTDMSQPLGEWVGHASELREVLDCLEGRGPVETVHLTLTLAEEITRLLEVDLDRRRLAAILDSGRARERFLAWAAAQGGDPAWLASPRLDLAPVEVVLAAPTAGVLARVRTRELGRLLGEAGAARATPEGAIDPGVALRYRARLGRRLGEGEELARLYLRREDPALVARFAACFELGEAGSAPPLVRGRVD
jgi:pyrimidine-nucleoside phosphorylase